MKMSRLHVSHCLVAFTLLFAVCFAYSPSADAQISRFELIEKEQKTKAAHLGSEGPTVMETWVVRVENLPVLSNTSGAYPWLGTIYNGAGLGVGAGYVRRMPDGAYLNAVGAVSVYGSTLLKARAGAPEFIHGRLALELDARHAIAKDLSFYGLGPSSNRTDPLMYEHRPAGVGVTAAFHPMRWITMSGRYEWTAFRSEPNMPVTAEEAPGIGRKLAYHVIEAGAALDWRTSPGYSTRGGLHRLTWSRYFEAHDRPFSFQKLEYEAVQLVPILRAQYVFAFRALATFTEAEGSDAVPVVLAPYLGDGETLRGFDTRRFTDHNRLLFTAEYRWLPSRYLDMALFWDTGEVAEHRSGFQLSKFRSDWGVGARFHGPKFVVIRSEIAKSSEGWRFIISEGNVF